MKLKPRSSCENGVPRPAGGCQAPSGHLPNQMRRIQIVRGCPGNRCRTPELLQVLSAR